MTRAPWARRLHDTPANAWRAGAGPRRRARPGLEVDLEAGLHDVARARDAEGSAAGEGLAIREVGVHVVQHDARVREEVPVDACGQVPEFAAADVAVGQVEVGEAGGELPG